MTKVREFPLAGQRSRCFRKPIGFGSENEDVRLLSVNALAWRKEGRGLAPQILDKIEGICRKDRSRPVRTDGLNTNRQALQTD